jgi:non-homologous end joining protein Ku
MRNKYIEEIDVMLMDTYLRWKDDVRHADRLLSNEDNTKEVLEMHTPELMDMFLDEVQIFAAKRND